MATDCDELELGQDGADRWVIPASLISCDVERDISEWFCRTNTAEASRPAAYSVAYYDIDFDTPIIELAELPSGDKRTFDGLVAQWKEETWFTSSIKKRIAHPAYLKIIGLGRVAVPWILQELRREPDYWYAALEAITRTDPVPHAENMSQLLDGWLAWGKANGY
jgi:hypothetical protein